MTTEEKKNIALKYFENSKAINFDDFYRGFESAFLEIETQNALKTDRKSGKFIINDFIHLDKNYPNNFSQGVYREEGKEIVTDGRYLIVHNENNYDPSLEGKIVDIYGKILNARFPNYKRVLPDDANLKPSPISFSFEDLKKINVAIKTKSPDKLSKIFVGIKDNYYNIAFNALILKNLYRFMNVYNDAKLFAPVDDEDRLGKAWKIIDEKTGDFMIFMPCDARIGTSYTYDTQNKIISSN